MLIAGLQHTQWHCYHNIPRTRCIGSLKCKI